MKRLYRFCVCFFLVFILLGCSKKKVSENQVVHIAIQPSAAFIPLYVVRYNGLLEQALKAKKVDVVWQDFESGPPMNQSLSAGLSDIGVIGDVPTVTALTRVVPMKIVGIPASGADAYAMLSRADDSTFNTAADMKGKKIATVFGSTGHNFTMKLLANNGLSFDDIDFISISAGDAQDSLASGLCDAVVIWEPNVTRLIDSGIAKLVASGSQTDLRGTNAFVVRSEYLAEHREVIQVILEQFYNAVKQLDNLDSQTLQKLSDALEITPSQVQSIIKKYDFSVYVTQKDIASLQDTVRFLVEIGNMDVPFNVSAHAENVLQKQ